MVNIHAEDNENGFNTLSSAIYAINIILLALNVLLPLFYKVHWQQSTTNSIAIKLLVNVDKKDFINAAKRTRLHYLFCSTLENALFEDAYSKSLEVLYIRPNVLPTSYGLKANKYHSIRLDSKATFDHDYVFTHMSSVRGGAKLHGPNININGYSRTLGLDQEGDELEMTFDSESRKTLEATDKDIKFRFANDNTNNNSSNINTGNYNSSLRQNTLDTITAEAETAVPPTHNLSVKYVKAERISIDSHSKTGVAGGSELYENNDADFATNINNNKQATAGIAGKDTTDKNRDTDRDSDDDDEEDIEHQTTLTVLVAETVAKMLDVDDDNDDNDGNEDDDGENDNDDNDNDNEKNNEHLDVDHLNKSKYSNLSNPDPSNLNALLVDTGSREFTAGSNTEATETTTAKGGFNRVQSVSVGGGPNADRKTQYEPKHYPFDYGFMVGFLIHSTMSENNLVLFKNIKKSCQNGIMQEKIQKMWNLNRKPNEIILKECHALQTDGNLGNDLWNAIVRKSNQFLSLDQGIESVNIDDLQVDDQYSDGFSDDDEETSDDNNDDNKDNENKNANGDDKENDKNNKKKDKNNDKVKNNGKSSSKHNLNGKLTVSGKNTLNKYSRTHSATNSSNTSRTNSTSATGSVIKHKTSKPNVKLETTKASKHLTNDLNSSKELASLGDDPDGIYKTAPPITPFEEQKFDFGEEPATGGNDNGNDNGNGNGNSDANVNANVNANANASIGGDSINSNKNENVDTDNPSSLGDKPTHASMHPSSNAL